ncbi:MAG: GNAT family N-acetyltransferase, partial [Oscillospiraceae bacterium]|nr:GNAT family N-acetyltransferase [Oscillospiraceae bacterium]
SNGLSPWISSLLIHPAERGNGYGGMLLKHVRREAAKLGFIKLYLATNHIGYYEKYGFHEFGLANLSFGTPTKIYEANSIGLTRIKEILLAKYPDTEAILIRGSYARGDGIDVQDIDLTVFRPECESKEEHIFENGVFYDLCIEPISFLEPMTKLLDHPYLAGGYADAKVLFDKTGKMEEYLSNFRAEYVKPLHFKARVECLIRQLDEQYQKVMGAQTEIDVHCRFATYTWTLCDVVLTATLKSTSWIRGLQKVGKDDKAMMNKIIDAEGHKTLSREQITALLPLYSELWSGAFWDFLKREIEWLILNISEPVGFHSLNICFMMGLDHATDKSEMFARWRTIIGGYQILPLSSSAGFKDFHNDALAYLNGKIEARQ